MFANSSNDIAGRLRENPRVATLEGGLVRKWRKIYGLTLEALGNACPKTLTRSHVHNIESGRGSASVETLINVIRGLERAGGDPLGPDDQARLATFFQGPDRREAYERAVAAAARLVASQKGSKRG